MLGKKRKQGKQISELSIGDTYKVTKKITDKDLLIYLGLTDDANPLYIQHDYASQTPYKQPLVPSGMISGMVSSIISMELPGPGSHIIEHNMTFPHPVYHYGEINFKIEITSIDNDNHKLTIDVIGEDNDENHVVSGKVTVTPPYRLESITANTLNNF